jgi:hypothetical protein
LPCSRGRARTRVIPHLPRPVGRLRTASTREAAGLRPQSLPLALCELVRAVTEGVGDRAPPPGRLSGEVGPTAVRALRTAATASGESPPGDGGHVSRRTTSLEPSVLAGTRGWDVQRPRGDGAVRSRLNRRGDRCSEFSRAALTGGTSPGKGPRRDLVLSASWACPSVGLDSLALDSRC